MYMRAKKHKNEHVEGFKGGRNGLDLVRPLPMSKEQMAEWGWDQVDVILVTGDGYVDHPSFGVALIGRWLVKHGYRVGVLAQPDWRSVADFQKLGPPKLFWGITSGAVDSRLNAYSSMGHKRSEDVYSPGGRADLRPGKPILAYAARVREAYKGIPIILGGLEASLRRLVHYDYIEDKLKRSILLDAKADMLVFGMGEQAILTIARRLAAGEGIDDLTDIPGTAYSLIRDRAVPGELVELTGLEQVQGEAALFMEAQKQYQRQSHPAGKAVIQDQGAGKVVILPPPGPLSSEQMDEIYDMDFTRRAHPDYDALGGIPALQSIQFSITSHRGCFGGCAFCSIYFHQGKYISSRSVESVLKEAGRLGEHPDFRGTISDVGGPSANMYGMRCTLGKPCTRESCLFPAICKNLDADSGPQVELMKAFLQWSAGRKKKVNVYIASGIRHDLVLHSMKSARRPMEYLDLLAGNFVGGHLKLAPEHYVDKVLRYMGKSRFEDFEEFERMFAAASKRAGKEQYIVPYFISAHPGCDCDDALELCEYLLGRGWKVRQVQDFTPVPLTPATAMYVSGLDSAGRKLHVGRGRKEKALQAALLKYYEPRNWPVIREFLEGKGRKFEGLLKRIKGAGSGRRGK